MGKCPNISGTFVNAGDSGGRMQQFNCNHQYPDSGSGYWHCSNALAKNLTLASDSDDALITIDQANDATIRVTVLHEKQPVEVVELSRRHGDFHCGKSGVEFYHLGSAVPPIMTAIGIISLQAVAATTLRSFQRAIGDVRTGHIRWPAVGQSRA